MAETDEEDARERAERLRREIEDALHGEHRPRSPREFVAEQMRRAELEKATDDEDAADADASGDPPSR
jgi:hypothetical protein